MTTDQKGWLGMTVLRCFTRRVAAAIFIAAVAVVALGSGFFGQTRVAAQGGIPPEVLAYADAIYTNGKVLTVDNNFSTQQAFAVRDGKFIGVGTTAAIQRYAGPKTQRFNLAGKTVIPGIIDAHIHLQSPMQKDQAEVEAKEPKYKDYNNRGKADGGTIQEVLDSIKKIVDGRKPGTWVSVEIPPALERVFRDKVRVADLDRVAPNNPLVVGAVDSLVNTQVMNEMRKRFGAVSEEMMETGVADTIDGRAINGDILIEHPWESMYGPLKRRLENTTQFGVTTWSSSLTPLWMADMYREMARRGDAPLRFGYGHSMAATVNPDSYKTYQRLGNLAGVGDDMVWIIGSSVVVSDSSPQDGCSTLNGKRRCPLIRPTAELHRAMFEMIKAGQRLTATHDSGDYTPDLTMDIIEEASAAAGLTADQIRAKAHVIDHCRMYPRPDQIERGKKLGIIWNCGANSLDGTAEMLAAEYGTEYAHKLASPVGAILRAGGLVAGHGEGIQGDSYFTLPEELVTRKNGKGNVWGKDQAINRTQLLQMYTIWNAKALLRGDKIGSIEPNKLADFAILDGDYMTVADDQLHTLKALLTVMGGKVTYTRPGFTMTAAN